MLEDKRKEYELIFGLSLVSKGTFKDMAALYDKFVAFFKENNLEKMEDHLTVQPYNVMR